MSEIIFRNKKIHYSVAGNGPAVMMVHGFGENSAVYSRQLDFLKNDFKIILPDLPGSGSSEALDDQPSLEDFADCLYKIWKKEMVTEKFSLLGHSMGGYTTMAFVERYPECLFSYGLLHSSAYADTPEKKEIRKKGIEFIKSHGGKAFLKTITPDLFSDKSREIHPEYPVELLSLSDGINDKTLIQYYHAMMNRPDRFHLLGATPLPVLFLMGKFDKVVPLEISLIQSRQPSISSVQLLENSAHMGLWEEPDISNHAIRNFLKDFH